MNRKKWPLPEGRGVRYGFQEMADEEHQKHQATMRIDITPAMLEQLQQAPVPGAARISSRPGGLHAGPRAGGPGVIRIPASPARPLGGEDFQVLLQSIYDAVFITDPQGMIVGANVRAEQFFAAKRPELCKKNVFDWLVGAERSLLDTILGSSGEQPVRADPGAVPADGRVRCFPGGEFGEPPVTGGGKTP
jgi:PAS domain-containing protein